MGMMFLGDKIFVRIATWSYLDIYNIILGALRSDNE